LENLPLVVLHNDAVDSIMASEMNDLRRSVEQASSQVNHSHRNGWN
jgi:hypothetical protein